MNKNISIFYVKLFFILNLNIITTYNLYGTHSLQENIFPEIGKKYHLPSISERSDSESDKSLPKSPSDPTPLNLKDIDIYSTNSKEQLTLTSKRDSQRRSLATSIASSKGDLEIKYMEAFDKGYQSGYKDGCKSCYKKAILDSKEYIETQLGKNQKKMTMINLTGFPVSLKFDKYDEDIDLHPGKKIIIKNVEIGKKFEIIIWGYDKKLKGKIKKENQVIKIMPEQRDDGIFKPIILQEDTSTNGSHVDQSSTFEESDLDSLVNKIHSSN